MSKITLGQLTTLNNNSILAQSNTNFGIIQTAFDNTLSRDGTSPNPMLAPLDMNSNQILNLPPPSSQSSPLRVQDVSVNAAQIVAMLSNNNTWTGANTYSNTVTFNGLSNFNNINTFSNLIKLGPTSPQIPIKSTGTFYYDNTGGFSEHNSPLTISVDLGTLAPPSLIPSTFIFTQSRGDNTNFVGGAGMFVQTQDRAGVTSLNKGVLYGVDINIAPSVARNNSPFDDATGLLVSNQGSGKATDAIFIGRNVGIVGSEWASTFTINANADFAFLANGAYLYGIDFVNGGPATFTNAAIRIPNNVLIVGRNVANNADVNAWKIDTSNLLSLANSTTTINPSTGAVALSGDLTVTVNDASQFTINNPSGTFSLAQWQNAGSVKGQIYWNNGANNFTWNSVLQSSFQANSTAALTIFTSGGIGIGAAAADPGVNNLVATDLFTNDATFLIRTKTSLTNNAAANTATLTNAPTAGNPTKWFSIDDNGTTRRIPAW